MLRKGAIPTGDLLGSIRELSRDDVARLRDQRTVPVVQRLRDPHHRLARCLAAGLRDEDAGLQSGYSIGSVRVLKRDPTFMNLVAEYRNDVNDSWRESVDHYHDMSVSNMLKAERQITEHLDRADESGELVPLPRLLALTADKADRFGYGKKQTNVNVNVDFAARLERASSRSARIIDALPSKPVLPPASGGTVASPSTSLPLPPRIARRA